MSLYHIFLFLSSPALLSAQDKNSPESTADSELLLQAILQIVILIKFGGHRTFEGIGPGAQRRNALGRGVGNDNQWFKMKYPQVSPFFNGR